SADPPFYHGRRTPAGGRRIRSPPLRVSWPGLSSTPGGTPVRARAVAAIALSGALALSLSGCTMWMHVETARPYHPSDGVNVTVGDLQLRNVLVLTEDGELGNLIGTAVNLTGSDIDFTVQWKADGQYQ